MSGPSGATQTPAKEPVTPKKTLFLSMEEDNDNELPPLGGKFVVFQSPASGNVQDIYHCMPLLSFIITLTGILQDECLKSRK